MAYQRRYKEEHGESYMLRYREKRNARSREDSATGRYSVEKRCEQCKCMRRMRTDVKFCSRRCSAESRRDLSRLPVVHPAPSPLSWLPANHPAVRPSSAVTPILFVAGRCVRCDGPFVVAYQTENRYCSERCGKGDGKARRRARKRDAFVAPVSRARIFERDDWRCQICKKKVRRDAVVPHPKAPVLDHIIPLADGGTHEPANVQCAHHLCNCIKSAGAANDQLRLIG